MTEPGGADVVDVVRRHLADLADLPAAEQVGAYEQVHRLLQVALARLDGS